MNNPFSSFSTNNCFIALLEFSQIMGTTKLYQSGDLKGFDMKPFLDYLAFTPIGSLDENIKQQPTVLQSTFEKIPFTAFFFPIADTEARGFSRALILAVAHSYLQLEDTQPYLNIIDKIQDQAQNLFETEIADYFSTLKQLLKDTPKTDSRIEILEAKLAQVQRILEKSHFTLKEGKANPNAIIDDFLMIKDSIRPATDLIDLDSLQNDFFIASNSFPGSKSMEIRNHLQENSSLNIASNILRFDNNLAQIICSISEIHLPIISLFELSPALGHCIFALLSGRSLALNVLNFNQLKAILSIFIPPFSNASIIDISKKDDTISENDIKPSKTLSICDMEKREYKGIVAPDMSMIWNFAIISPGEGAESFVAKSIYLVQRMADKLILKLEKYGDREPVFVGNFLCETGFSRDDFGILAYWIENIPKYSSLAAVLRDNEFVEFFGTVCV